MQRRYALTEMMGLFAMSFAYGLIFQSLVMLVIPAEVQRLTHRKQSVWMSLIMAGGALSHLGTPIVGAWSDRLHKRVSFLVYGALTCILGTMLFLMVLASNSMLLLFIAHVTTMVGLSVVYSMICALLNDCILPEQIGQGSGTLAILGTLGSGCGYALFAASIPLEYTYGGYVLACVACLGISVLYIPNNLDAMLKQAAEKVKENRERELIRMEQERQDRGDPDDADVDMLLPPSPAERRHTASATTLLLDAITMPSPTKYPDFTLACLSRMLFNAGLAAQVYMMYYFRDIQKLKAPTQRVSLIAVSTLVGCIVAALPAGIISDKVGKKPVIYTGVCICTVSVVAFFVMWSQDLFLVLGVFYGVGNISYLSVDYALGVAALPRYDPKVDSPVMQAAGSTPVLGQPVDAAKDLGIFAMSATLGAVIGQVLYGGILDFNADVDPVTGATVYEVQGFHIAFGFAAVFFSLSGLSVKWIKAVR
eukprot:Rhum_TRINITY_DN23427_c0_g1::Rhum_TRINITY_DN23427_c0_g1_i1::g.177886::m.177886